MQMLTAIGEFAYPSVFRPSAPMEGDTTKDPQYQLTVLWHKDDEGKLKKLKSKIEEVAVEKWGKKAVDMLKKGQLKNPLRDGDEREADWMDDHFFLTARSSDKPGCVDEDLEDIIDTNEIYPGAIGRMDIWLYAYDKAGNKGVGAILNNVQKTAPGERKDGRQSASEAFGAAEDDDNSSRSSKADKGKDKKKSKKDKDDSSKSSRKKKKK